MYVCGAKRSGVMYERMWSEAFILLELDSSGSVELDGETGELRSNPNRGGSLYMWLVFWNSVVLEAQQTYSLESS